MFVEDNNAILGNDSTSANSNHSMETTETAINLPKHKEEKMRRRKNDADDRHLRLCEVDSHDNLLALPHDSPLLNFANDKAAGKNW